MICAYYSEQSERRVYLTETRHAVAHLAIPEGILGMIYAYYVTVVYLQITRNFPPYWNTISTEDQKKLS